MHCCRRGRTQNQLNLLRVKTLRSTRSPGAETSNWNPFDRYLLFPDINHSRKEPCSEMSRYRLPEDTPPFVFPPQISSQPQVLRGSAPPALSLLFPVSTHPFVFPLLILCDTLPSLPQLTLTRQPSTREITPPPQQPSREISELTPQRAPRVSAAAVATRRRRIRHGVDSVVIPSEGFNVNTVFPSARAEELEADGRWQ